MPSISSARQRRQGSNCLSAERRYQVFISSTLKDLANERKGAMEAVYERGHIPLAFENFSPADTSDREVIERAIRESQVYLLILGHRYGKLMPGDEISYTEFEYDLAEKYGLMRLVFVMEPALITERRSKLDPNDKFDDLELKNYERLLRFHTRIERFRRFFSPGPQFKYVVELALEENLHDSKRPGFIREPSDPALLEGVRNEFIGAIVSELTSFEKLYERTKEQPAKKNGLAHFFVQQYMDRLLENRVSLFFESGSTVAFLARAMSRPLSKAVKLEENGAPTIQISTNNVLAYLLLWLNARIPCTKFPWSPPVETTYGAAYGGLENLVSKDPDYVLPPFDDSARAEIRRLQNAAFSLTTMKRPTLLLGAASGLQLRDNHRLKFPKGISDRRKEELTAQLLTCFGPHVGSYHNKIFKRFMYDTKLPIVVFLNSDKIDSEIEVGKCHFILDSEFRWENFFREHPLAFCVGCGCDERDAYQRIFEEKLGFDCIAENTASPISCFIARNRPFIQDFESSLARRAAAASAGL